MRHHPLLSSTLLASAISKNQPLSSQASGPRRTQFSATAFAFCAYPIYAFVGAAPSVERLFVSQLAATLFLGLMSGPHPGMLAALFPTGARTTGVALSYNLAVKWTF